MAKHPLEPLNADEFRQTATILRRDGHWTATVAIGEMGIPDSVRQVIARRLSRLSQEANRLLSVGSAFNGAFRFDIAARVAGLAEAQALDAVDEALGAQLLVPSGQADTCDFTHALVRHTLYEQLSPPRQARLHRQIAEGMEQAYGALVEEHAAAVAEQYHRSKDLPGAERGVPYAVAAADRAAANPATPSVRRRCSRPPLRSFGTSACPAGFAAASTCCARARSGGPKSEQQSLNSDPQSNTARGFTPG